jgi:site-specific recombinase XerD
MTEKPLLYCVATAYDCGEMDTIHDSSLADTDLEINLDSFQIHLEVLNRSRQTVTHYIGAMNQLARFLEEKGMPRTVANIHREHVEAFLHDMLHVQHYKPSSVLNRYKGIQAFFAWLKEEGEITETPFAKMRPPSVPDDEPVIPAPEVIKKLLAVCEKGRTFIDRRDTAIIRCLVDTGGRRAAVANIEVQNVDIKTRTIKTVVKGGATFSMPIGAKTIQALDRYQRMRAKHALADSQWLWVGNRGHLTDSGILQMLETRCLQAGIPKIHPHQFRHYFAHQWRLEGGGDDELMRLMNWSSRTMLNRYARSAANERASEAHRRLSPGDRL